MMQKQMEKMMPLIFRQFIEVVLVSFRYSLKVINEVVFLQS